MKRLDFVLLVSLMASLVSCGQTGDSEALKLGAMSSMDFVPFAVAKEKGICDSLGVNLEIVKFFSPNERDAALQAGTVDGTVTDLTGAMMLQSAGMDIRIAMGGDGYFTMMASNESDIVRGIGYAGCSYAISSNTAIEFVTDHILTLNGVRPSDAEKVEVNRIPLRLEMLQAGKVDAAVLPDPFASIARQNGLAAVADTREFGLNLTCTVFSGSAISEKKDVIVSLIKCYNCAVDYIMSHSPEDFADVLTGYAGVPADMVSVIELPEYRHAALPDSSSVEVSLDWLRSKKLVGEDYTSDKLFISKLF